MILGLTVMPELVALWRTLKKRKRYEDHYIVPTERLGCGLIGIMKRALVGMAHWIECWPVNQRVTSSIPSQGTCLGCGPGP